MQSLRWPEFENFRAEHAPHINLEMFSIPDLNPKRCKHSPNCQVLPTNTQRTIHRPWASDPWAADPATTTLRHLGAFLLEMPHTLYGTTAAANLRLPYSSVFSCRTATSSFHFMTALRPRMLVNSTKTPPCHKVGIPLYDSRRARETGNYQAIRVQS